MNSEDISNFQDKLYASEIPILLSIQNTFDGYGEWLQNVSKIGDPGLAFVFYFPFIFAINALSGVKYLGALIVCEWMNLVLKWLLHGERPYWWTRESSIPVDLVQTPVTCETGPGNPSGHVMLSVVLWYTMYDVITKILDSGVPSKSTGPVSPLRLMIGRLLWNGVILMLFLTIASRTYISTHFLHQCVLALVFGLFCYKLAYEKVKWINYPILGLLFLAVLFPAVSIAVHSNLEQLVGFSPDWSIEKATQWCQNKAWIYLDTTPLYAMVRFSGSALGLAFAIGAHRLKKWKLSRNFLTSPTQKMIQLMFGLVLGQICTGIHKLVPRSDMQTYYIAEYSLNGVFVFLVAVGLPAIIKSLFPGSGPSKRRKSSN